MIRVMERIFLERIMELVFAKAKEAYHVASGPNCSFFLG